MENSNAALVRGLVLTAGVAGLLWLAGCSSGSGSGQNTQPPSLEYPTSNAVYTRGTAITPDAPVNIGGPANSYTVAPALPAGLSLNTTTGTISGTPTAVAAQATYTVTASNAGGNGTATVTITVNDIPPAELTYSANPATYAATVAITPDTPSWSSSGGTPTGFAITAGPGLLPQGLTLDPATGIINGTPAAQAARGVYTITASNTGGSTMANITLTVIPQPPYITTQPASQTVGSGISTYFSVGYGGGGIVSFQWYKNGTAISNSNNAVYGTPVLTSADNGEQYYVVISDNYGRSVTSNTAILTVSGTAGTFVNTGTPTVARECDSATLLQNGTVLIVGGRSGNIAIATAEIYNPATGEFTVTGFPNESRVCPSTTLLANGQVLVAGGYAFGNSSSLPTLASAELYDPTTGRFTLTGSLVTARVGHSATLLPSGKVLVAGGTTSNDGYEYSTLSSAELYDPVAGTFSSTGSLNVARSAPAVLLNDGQVLVPGGISLNAGVLASAELYDPTTGTFSPTGSLITARSASAALLQNGQVLLPGGAGANDTVLSSAELYDPSTGTFSATGSLNAARTSLAILLNSGQVLLVGGGIGGPNQWANMSELYDPPSGSFIVNASTNSTRFTLTATLLGNGQVLVEGQETSAVMVTQPVPAELYQP